MTSTLRAKSAIGLFLVALLGCQSASPPQSFVLVAWPPAETLPGDPADGPALVVDPITLPDYLDRSQPTLTDCFSLQPASTPASSQPPPQPPTRLQTA